MLVFHGPEGMKNITDLVYLDINFHNLETFMLELLKRHSVSLGVVYIWVMKGIGCNFCNWMRFALVSGRIHRIINSVHINVAFETRCMCRKRIVYLESTFLDVEIRSGQISEGGRNFLNPRRMVWACECRSDIVIINNSN